MRWASSSTNTRWQPPAAGSAYAFANRPAGGGWWTVPWGSRCSSALLPTAVTRPARACSTRAASARRHWRRKNAWQWWAPVAPASPVPTSCCARALTWTCWKCRTRPAAWPRSASPATACPRMCCGPNPKTPSSGWADVCAMAGGWGRTIRSATCSARATTQCSSVTAPARARCWVLPAKIRPPTATTRASTSCVPCTTRWNTTFRSS